MTGSQAVVGILHPVAWAPRLLPRFGALGRQCCGVRPAVVPRLSAGLTKRG